MDQRSPAMAVLLGFLATTVTAQTTRSFPRHDLDHPAEFRPDYRDKDQWERRAAALRTQTLVAAGLWPMPRRSPLKPVIHGRIDRDGYTVEKVSFTSLPGHYVTGNLYRPKNHSSKRPAVLSPHGHWPGGRFMWRSDVEAQKEIDAGAERSIGNARSLLQSRCASLARMGCVVFHCDMLGYGDSTAITHREGFSDVEATLRLQSQLGVQTWNSIRGLDFLSSLPDVDASRIAVTGASGGGTQTFLVCAVDDRPAVSFPAVMVSMEMQGGCVCENAPLLRIGTNNVELACLFAPKPLAMTGANDWTRHIQTRGLPEAKHIYALYGAANHVAAKYFPFEHNYNRVSRAYMYEWMNTHLKLGLSSPVEEHAIEPIPPEHLSVYDRDHPRPADEADAAALRAWMTKDSDAQLDELKSETELYRSMLREALSAMIAVGDPQAASACETIRPDRPSGRAVIWVSSDRPGGEALQKLMDQRVTVFWPLPSVAGAQPVKADTYAGFTLGYNRSALAQQAVDSLQTIIDVSARAETTSLDLVSTGRAGPAAAIVCALAGDRVRRAVIDLDGFDFDQISDAADDRILPGALKYGGMNAITSLCTSHDVKFVNRAAAGGDEPKLNADEIVERLLK